MYPLCVHCLCNAHITRNLTEFVLAGQKWAYDLKEYLLDLNDLVDCYGGVLPTAMQLQARKHYGRIIAAGFEETKGLELPRPPDGKSRRGRAPRPPCRNLLADLAKHKDAVLRFMTSPHIPFTNNDAERRFRMTKVHMKIIGCFRSWEMAKGFCRMRGYVVSCQKNGVSAYKAIESLIAGQTPDFIRDRLAAPDSEALADDAA
jgi:transposase